MVHPGITTTFAHGLIKKIIGRGGSKLFDITATEATDRFRNELKFRDRHEIQRAQLIVTALRLRIKAADCFQRIAKKIEPHRKIQTRRKEIENTAAHRTL